MSNKKVFAAEVPEFQGPNFHDPVIEGKRRGLSRVQKRLGYHPERFNQMLFDRVAKALPNGSVKMYPHTTDGYLWTAGICFTQNGNEFMVLIPMLHDSNRKDGTYADRHAALYARREASKEALNAAALLFADAFVKQYKAKYGNAIKHSKQQNGIPV